MTSPDTPTGLRAAVSSWRWLAWVLLSVLVVLGLVAALGGFARAAPLQGPRVDPGQAIELMRFRVAVDRVELVDVDAYGGDADPTLLVTLQATNTSDRSVSGLPSGMVAVVADGVTLPDGYLDGVGARGTALDPGHQQVTRFTVGWTATQAPSEVDVVVYDEKPPENYLDDGTTPDLDPSHPAAVAAVPVLDQRKRR